MPTTKKLNLKQKIADVKKNIDVFIKDGKGYNYEYVTGSQILWKIRAKMEEHNLLLYPSIEKAEWQEIQVLVKGKMKPNILVSLVIHYTFEDADSDEKKIVPFYAIGHQADASQAYGTALTYAERYFLLKFFNIPTDEDDPDAKQKRDKYTKADSKDIEVLKTAIIDFANTMGDTEERVKTSLGIKQYADLSVAECMQKLTEIVNLKRQFGGKQQ